MTRFAHPRCTVRVLDRLLLRQRRAELKEFLLTHRDLVSTSTTDGYRVMLNAQQLEGVYLRTRQARHHLCTVVLDELVQWQQTSQQQAKRHARLVAEERQAAKVRKALLKVKHRLSSTVRDCCIRPSKKKRKMDTQ